MMRFFSIFKSSSEFDLRIPLSFRHGEEAGLPFFELGHRSEPLPLDTFSACCYSFGMDRTIVVQLTPTPEQASILQRTLAEHTACFNAVARLGFTEQCHNGVHLHKQTYYPLRAQYPDLPAQLVCAARVKATEAVTSALTWQKKHEHRYLKQVAQAKQQGKHPPRFTPVRCPHSACASIRYDARSSWVKWQTSTASLATAFLPIGGTKGRRSSPHNRE
jgi:hypothetical protein